MISQFANKTTQNNALTVPGQVKISRIDLISYTGVSVDLINVFESLEIYEDLYSNTLSGELLLVEALNLTQNIPIVGREYVIVEFATPSCPDNRVIFSVYKVSPRAKFKTENAQLYTLHLCAPEFLKNASIQISKSYTGMEHHKMVLDIWETYLSPASDKLTDLQYHTTTGQFNFIIPNWNPFKAINVIGSRAQDSDNPYACNMLFYQDLDSFKFVSMDKLLGQKPAQKYIVRRANLRDRNDIPDIKNDLRIVQQYSFKSTWNRVQDLSQGAYAGSVYIHDATNKAFEVYEYDYVDQFENTNHAGKFPLLPTSDSDFTKSKTAMQTLFPRSLSKFSNRTDNENPELWVLQQQAMMTHIHSIQCEITVPGDSRRRVGEIVEFEVPSPEESRTTNRYFDEYLSGSYLITSINHSITKTDYLCHMELSKDALGRQIPDTKSPITV